MTTEEQDRHFMTRCLELAAKAAESGEVPVGAVVVNNITGEVVSEALNQREQLQTPLGHAEAIAIHRACRKLGTWRLIGHTLYTSLEPCVMCSGVIIQARLDRVVYGAADPKGGGSSLFDLLNRPELNHRPVLTAGVFNEKAGELLKDFFKQRR